MPWMTAEAVTVEDRRLDFCRLATAGGVPFAELCRRFNVSRKTGYKWLARFQAEGVTGLVNRSRAPARSPGRTSGVVEDLVVAVRRAHPAWGGRKIRGFLLRQGHREVPAASTITQILRRHELLNNPGEPRVYQSFEHAAPNDLWQMDFKGWFRLATRQRVHTLGVLDDHSRYNLCLVACPNQRTSTVQHYLGAAFERYGLPSQMLMDNGSPWGNDRGQPWTPLTLWLTDLGIWVVHSRPFHPQTAGKQERFHRTLDLEVLHQLPHWDTYTQVQDAYNAWRPIYNHHRPHQALGETTVPADRYQPSPRGFPTRIPPVEYPDGTQVRKVSSTGRFSWQGQLYRVPKAFKGRLIGIRPTPTDGTYIIYYRHHPIRTITPTTGVTHVPEHL